MATNGAPERSASADPQVASLRPAGPRPAGGSPTEPRPAGGSPAVGSPAVGSPAGPRPPSRSASRPRDALGRPLPHGAVGVPPLPASTPLVPAAALAEAQRLLDLGRPFQAHEILEAVWKNADADERDLWRGLAQLAVGVTHLARGNVKGGIAVLGRGAENLAPYADDPPHGVDVPSLLTWVRERTAEITRARTTPTPAEPTITASGPAAVPATATAGTSPAGPSAPLPRLICR